MKKNKILLLAPATSEISNILSNKNILYDSTMDVLRVEQLQDANYGVLLSFGYRFKLSPKILALFDTRLAINLHISLLPYNRGSDPNLWSFYDNTPKGVTIHCINSRLDEGDILLQESVLFDMQTETLATSYGTLQKTILDLFVNNMEEILNARISPRPQFGKGSYHRSSDKNKIMDTLVKRRQNVWDTPVYEVYEMGKAARVKNND